METDNNLVTKAKSGDHNAFSELVLRHQKSLLRLAYRVLGDFEAAQDVVQESWLKAHQKLGSFEGRSAFKSWVFQITLNTAKNKLRGRRPELIEIDKSPLADDTDIEGDMMRDDLKTAMKTEIAKLPEKQRHALSLRIYDDLSFAEIAEAMACPYDTAKANYRHALIKLRDRLSETLRQEGWRQYQTRKEKQLEAEA